MQLKRLSIAEMLALSEPWVTAGSAAHRALSAVPEVAGLLPRIAAAHAGLLKTQRREDPRLAKRVPADALFYGGFIFRSANATPCGMRSRCVHVFATRDHGRHMDVHAIVDLMRARVVITDADPAMGGIADPVKKGG